MLAGFSMKSYYFIIKYRNKGSGRMHLNALLPRCGMRFSDTILQY